MRYVPVFALALLIFAGCDSASLEPEDDNLECIEVADGTLCAWRGPISLDDSTAFGGD